MKRSSFSRELENGKLNVEQMAMANCAMLLAGADNKAGWSLSGRVYKCKTCPREFNSFQALGGHRASHKKPKLMEKNMNEGEGGVEEKKHLCGVCGVGFGTGKALGGHMRKHRGTSTSDATIDLVGNMRHLYSAIRSTGEEVVDMEEGSSSSSSTINFRLFGADIYCPK